MSLLPKRMFRAYDKDGNRGNLFILEHKYGPDGKLFWRPDSKELPAGDAYFSDVNKSWESSKLAQSLTRYKEIPIDDDAMLLQVIHVGLKAGPSLNTSDE